MATFFLTVMTNLSAEPWGRFGKTHKSGWLGDAA